MLKTLIKKQLKELGYMYFRSKNKNNAFDKKNIILKVLLFSFLYLSLAVSFFAIGFALIESAHEFNMDWLYFAFMGSIALSLSTFANMFFAYSNLFMAKDNDLMLALPIKSKDIVLSKFIANFINCFVYASMVFIPAIVQYCIFYKGYQVIIFGLISLILISLISLVFANIIGFIISKISKYFKNRAYITVIITLLFLVVYYYFCFHLENYIESLAQNIQNLEVVYTTSLGIFYFIGMGTIGNLIHLLIATIIVVTIFGLCFLFIQNQYLKVIMTSSKDKKREYNLQVSKSNSLFSALIKKELKHFVSNATYLLNCGFGSIILIGIGIASFIYKARIHLIILEMNVIFGPIEEYIPLIIIAGLLFILSVSYYATPSVSLEGNNYWIVRSLPLDSYKVLDAKRYFEFLINGLPALFAIICIILNVNIQKEAMPILVVLVIVMTYAISYIHVSIGVLTARLDWTNEAVVIKQNLGCMIDIFGGWALIAALGFIYYLLMDKITVIQYMYALLVVFILIGKLLQKWLQTKGTQLFEKL